MQYLFVYKRLLRTTLYLKHEPDVIEISVIQSPFEKVKYVICSQVEKQRMCEHLRLNGFLRYNSMKSKS